MKIWLDDVRPAPIGWVWVKSAREMIAALLDNNGDIEIVSLDHDLGESKEDGTWLTYWIEQEAYNGTLEPFEWLIHSANPVGTKRMAITMKNAERYWYKNE